MTDSVRAAAATGAGANRQLAVPSAAGRRNQAVFAVATLAAWAHTIDEMRIGEFIAVPFGVANAALVAAWPRLTSGWQAAASIAWGLFWGLAVIPYHVAPLFGGEVTGQHVSGLSRIVAGAAMVALGIAIATRRRRNGPSPQPFH